MFRFLRKHRKILFVALAACIIGMIFFGIGTNVVTHSPYDSVIKVNGRKISQADFDRAYNQMMKQKSDLKPEERQQVMSQTMNELIREEVFDQESKKYGIFVSDQELQMQLLGTPAFQKNGKFDPQTYFQTLHQVFDMSPKEYEKIRMKDLAGRKVNMLIASAINVSDIELNDEIQNRLAKDTDKKIRKEIQENPEGVRDEMKNHELNLVFQDWLNNINSNLKVEIVSDSFKNRLSGKS
jgi:peptidyl-prolyl cis-trans isomerase D